MIPTASGQNKTRSKASSAAFARLNNCPAGGTTITVDIPNPPATIDQERISESCRADMREMEDALTTQFKDYADMDKGWYGRRRNAIANGVDGYLRKRSTTVCSNLK